jgi:chromosome partitioning protein
VPNSDAKPKPGLFMSVILAIVNQKGGVGKTTTAVNLGAALAEAGHSTLVIDFDPQANATRSLLQSSELEHTVYDSLIADPAVPLAEVILPTAIDGLQLAPATQALAGAEVELVGMVSREARLREALASYASDTEVVLIDCPPSLGLLSVNALVAADGVIVPVQCEYLSLEGLGALGSHTSIGPQALEQ